ncbi:MAG: 3-hydroxybutyryl-CoA dehydrogenase [Candidatus Hecatellales archaeon B24]|nr:MAG: 3-hydroxybutyryl-CoA dehydrogenase [Candidatus Hecatellales archaeon B24]
MGLEQIRKVCVVGAGVMGSGITQVFAQAGYSVVMVDVAEEFIQKGMASIKANLERSVAKGRMSKEDAEAVLGRIKTTLNLEEAGKEADFVVEAVVERMDVKREVFSRLDKACESHVILASNTSTLSITEMASATQRPDRVAGMHFFNPAPVMKLVEVIAGAKTSRETISTVKALAEKLGKTPVEVKESPGFVVNRLLTLMLNEACFLLMEDVAKPEDIDTAMKLGCNHPMGPFELMDLVGLDIVLAIAETLYQETGDPKFRPSPLLRKMVRAGLLGRKTGQGFYVYGKK